MPKVPDAESASFPSLCLQCSSTIPQVCLGPDHISALATLFDMASSTFSYGESVLPVFETFSGLFILMWVLPSYIHGTR